MANAPIVNGLDPDRGNSSGGDDISIGGEHFLHPPVTEGLLWAQATK
jgi:hypothetical protein